ncbi:citB product [Aeromonas hydrophila 4AK4]|uniref:response regulator n=1 Tax=Aeromonas rivipollensis TaxID=948519 RepID=UPI0003D7F67A|nr:response regulator [uncultured Aeromonas sp.]AHE49737.1 citB product [Aeromonas hydrophila 4AK4]MDU1142655.1 response regulator [Aeromonas hydrophila]
MIKILIVEDDPAIAEIHRRFVQRLAGFEVLGVALTLFDAREQIAILQPDLVLLDVWLPDGEGFSLLRELRQRGAHLDVILLTAAREAAALQEAMRLGVVDFILKPVVFERLRDTLGNYAESRAALAALADIDQQAVDALFGTPLQQVAAGGLPKGIDALTLQRVLAALNQEGASAEEIGNRVGVSRTTARRYLEFLVGQQLASPELEYGTVGRPERRYRQR